MGVAAGFLAFASLGRSFAVGRREPRSQDLRPLSWFAIRRTPATYWGTPGTSFATPRNALIAVATLLALNARAIVEESFPQRDPSYCEYLRDTRWRLVPYVY